MTDTPLMRECRDLIAFYDDRGADWTMALCFILFKALFGAAARIWNQREDEIIIRRRYKKP